MPLVGWWLYGLFDLDEGFYAAVVGEMNRRGEWITPYFNGQPWFEKPILLYWLAKPSVLVFGDWFGPRLPSILATVGTYGLVVWFCRRRFSDQVAKWSVLILASSVLFAGASRMMITDPVLVFCLTGAMVFFWESLQGKAALRLWSAFLLGLSVLAKGPVGLILFVLIAGYTCWRERELRPHFKGWWSLGVLILAATIASWYVPAYVVNGQAFVQKFLIEQNLNRFTGGDPAHSLKGPLNNLFFIPVVLIGSAPWCWHWIKGWPRRGSGSSELRFLATWAVVIFAFFTISGSKLVHYILPCFVPLAIIAGNYIASRRERLTMAYVACALVAVVVNGAFLYYYNSPVGGATAEADQMALYVRDTATARDSVSIYQMGRREASLGTGSLKIMETSRPSLMFYLRRTVYETESMDQLLNNGGGQWVITRWNRIGQKERDYAALGGRGLKQVQTPFKQEAYRLYYLSPAPAPRTRR